MNYSVRTLGKKCSGTGERLEPGSQCISALVFQDGQTTRQDFSEAGWNGPPPGTIAWWQVEVPAVNMSLKQLNPDTLMAYFEQLTEEAIPGRDHLRYVLALLLLKQRRVDIEGTRTEDDHENNNSTVYLQLVGSHSEGPYEVCDYGLPEEEIQQLQDQLMVAMLADED